jgi:hypothetical protein
MKNITLNIGLDLTSADGTTTKNGLDVARALSAVEACWPRLAARVQPSASELTLVVEVRATPGDRFERDLYTLSVACHQQAISAHYGDGTGTLQGPEAAAWGGKFLPTHFIGLDGRNLAEALLAELGA